MWRSQAVRVPWTQAPAPIWATENLAAIHFVIEAPNTPTPVMTPSTLSAVV